MERKEPIDQNKALAEAAEWLKQQGSTKGPHTAMLTKHHIALMLGHEPNEAQMADARKQFIIIE